MNDPNAPTTTGTLHVHLYSASQGIDTGVDVSVSAMTTSFLEFIGVLTTGVVSPAPSDLLLRVYADGLQLRRRRDRGQHRDFPHRAAV